MGETFKYDFNETGNNVDIFQQKEESWFIYIGTMFLKCITNLIVLQLWMNY